MRLYLVVHLLIASVFAAATAISCQLLFLIPFWLGGILGILSYAVIFIGIRADDRIE